MLLLLISPDDTHISTVYASRALAGDEVETLVSLSSAPGDYVPISDTDSPSRRKPVSSPVLPSDICQNVVFGQGPTSVYLIRARTSTQAVPTARAKRKEMWP